MRVKCRFNRASVPTRVFDLGSTHLSLTFESEKRALRVCSLNALLTSIIQRGVRDLIGDSISYFICLKECIVESLSIYM